MNSPGFPWIGDSLRNFHRLWKFGRRNFRRSALSPLGNARETRISGRIFGNVVSFLPNGRRNVRKRDGENPKPSQKRRNGEFRLLRYVFLLLFPSIRGNARRRADKTRYFPITTKGQALTSLGITARTGSFEKNRRGLWRLRVLRNTLEHQCVPEGFRRIFRLSGRISPNRPDIRNRKRRPRKTGTNRRRQGAVRPWRRLWFFSWEWKDGIEKHHIHERGITERN